MSTDTQFEFRVKGGDAANRSHAFTVTIVVDVKEPKEAKRILHYLRGVQVKQDFLHGWVRQNAPDCGMEIRGGPRPVFEDPEDRGSRVLAYEQDFRLTKSI